MVKEPNSLRKYTRQRKVNLSHIFEQPISSMKQLDTAAADPMAAQARYSQVAQTLKP